MNSKKQKKNSFVCEMSRLKSTGQVKAAASDWWHAVSQAEFEQSHDFQSQRAASQVAATLHESIGASDNGPTHLEQLFLCHRQQDPTAFLGHHESIGHIW